MSTNRKFSQEELEDILKDAWLDLKVDEEKLFNPLKSIPAELEDDPHLYIMWLFSRPEYFSFFCKEILGIQLLPIQALIIREMWNRKFPMLVGARGLGKSFLLGLYSLLRMIFIPGRKIVICGSAFRQSKIISNYMESIWDNAPILRDFVGHTKENGPHHEPDMYRFNIGESTSIALPVGSGEKIRGQRANDLLIDEFASLSREIFETVMSGFLSVKSSPAENVQQMAEIHLAKQLGYDRFQDKDDFIKGNQLIISGTAFYEFNHFAEYWKRWKAIIKSKGNKNKLAQAFGDTEPSEELNWRDYSIIRIPYGLIPKGFLDDSMIARAKATIHSGVFQMEYGACVAPGTQIITDTGLKNIEDIKVGDKVLTHKSRFKPVTKRFSRIHNNKIIKYRTYGYNEDIFVTSQHAYYINNNWRNIADLDKYTELLNLKELNEKYSIDLVDYCENFIIKNEDYICPITSQRKYKQEFLDEILSQPTKEIAKKYNVTNNKVYQWRHYAKKLNKYCIDRVVELDYSFGLICGYYTSEGSIGANGRAVSFALDGHHDNNLTQFVDELCLAINNVFPTINIGKYYSKDNACNVYFNNRLLADMFAKIMPGRCYEKFVNSNILYSNEDFMKGFIIGFWNGDGHKNKKFACSNIASKDLMSQIRLVLSYFNIGSSFCVHEGKKTIINNKEYDCRKLYELKITGKDFKRFCSLFYNINIDGSDRLNLIYNNNKSNIMRFKSKDLVDYSGFVYNLEVEDDNSYSLLNATVHNCFSNDSNGFFKRTLIESCVTTSQNALPDFNPVLVGNPRLRYVYGVDPASEIDNFAIIVLEIHEDHRRIVHSWTTNKAEHREKLKAGLVEETDFYGYCARKIRSLMNVFPCERIVIDSQGGGIAISEALHDKDKLQEKEHLIWPIIDPEKPKDTDVEAGLHLIELANFSSADWTSQANHGLRKDFEDKVCIFPRFDPALLALAAIRDGIDGKLYDTLEDCVMEIEELKDELSTIIIEQTPSGRDRWTTPEVKLPGNKKGYLRKDRYSALVMANMGARIMARTITPTYHITEGNFVRDTKVNDGRDYIGPDWFIIKMQGIYD